MAIEFTCAHCGAVLHAPADSEGKHVRCRECHQVVVIHAEATVLEPDAGNSGNQGDSAARAKRPSAQHSHTPPPSTRARELFETALSPETPHPEPHSTQPYHPYALAQAAEHGSHLPHIADVGHRDGPPWERDGRSIGTLFSTWIEAYSWRHSLFRYLHPTRGLAEPARFVLWGSLAPAVSGSLQQWPELIALLEEGNSAMLVGLVIGMLVGITIATLLIAAFLLLLAACAAVSIHGLLLLMRSAQFPLASTVRMSCYVMGATAIWLAVPVWGMTLFGLVHLLMTGIAVQKFHHTRTGVAVAVTVGGTLVALVLYWTAILLVTLVVVEILQSLR